MVGDKGNGRSSDVEAEVLRARRARGAARDPGALVRREDLTNCRFQTPTLKIPFAVRADESADWKSTMMANIEDDVFMEKLQEIDESLLNAAFKNQSTWWPGLKEKDKDWISSKHSKVMPTTKSRKSKKKSTRRKSTRSAPTKKCSRRRLNSKKMRGGVTRTRSGRTRKRKIEITNIPR